MDAKLISIVDEQILSCPICFERYAFEGIRTPKLLSCSHSFCESCLVDFTNCSAGTLILCPICRTATELGRDGVAALQSNFIALNLLDIVNTSAVEKHNVSQNSEDPNGEKINLLCQFESAKRGLLGRISGTY